MNELVFQQDPVGCFHQAVLEPRILGRNDCFLAISDVLKRPWHCDLMAGLRGNYSTYGEIRSLLTANGHASAVSFLQQRVSEAGGSLIEPEKIADQADDLDLGFLLVEDWHPSLQKLLVGLPAFFWAGKWVAMTRAGMLAADPDRAAFAWAKPGGA